MLSMTQEAGLCAGLDDFKRHCKNEPSEAKSDPETTSSEVVAQKEETNLVNMKVDGREDCMPPSTWDCEICKHSEVLLGSDLKATYGGSRHKTSSMLRKLDKCIRSSEDQSSLQNSAGQQSFKRKRKTKKKPKKGGG